MKAVPARAQAKGSRYQGEMEMRYRQAAMEEIEISTADQALSSLSSNTCDARHEQGEGQAETSC